MMSWIRAQKQRCVWFAGGLLIFALLLHFTELNQLQSFLLLTATLIASIPIASRAIRATRMKLPSIELLVTIAVVGAIVIGEYWESAIVTFLFLFGEYLEFRTLSKTRSALKELTDLTPLEADVIRYGEIVTVAAEAIQPGESVLVRSGGKIPVDGIILSGQAELTEAALTGESIPVVKKTGERVFSGTIVDSGYVEIRAEQVGEDTLFAQMIELVEEAQEAKSKTAKLLDRFAHFYTPAAVGLAILVYVWTQNLHMAVTFLVVACPGALVIGAPASSVAGIGSGAKQGVLIKGGDAIDRLSRVDTFVFDKTGTLTLGKPSVTHIELLNGRDKREFLRLVAQAELASEHHLGRAIVQAAQAHGISIDKQPEDVQILQGSGIQATVDEHHVVIGTYQLMLAESITVSATTQAYVAKKEREGHTVVFAAIDGVLAGLFSIADPIREDAAATLHELRNLGIRRFILLTGDNRHTAEIVATHLGIEEFHAKLLPQDKAAFIETLKSEGNVVAMIGDGINDAPAIAAAQIGLAMGGGTSVAMETADVILLANRLRTLPFAYSLARATVRNIRQNLALAIVTVIALLIGILAGSVHLASGMLIHEASVLLVILNAMRLAPHKRQHATPDHSFHWNPTEPVKEAS